MKLLHLVPLLIVTGALAAPAVPQVLAAEATKPAPMENSRPPVVRTVSPDAADNTLQLPPVLVTGSAAEANRVLTLEQPKRQRFTWVEGGYFWQQRVHGVVAEVKLQYHPGLAGFDLASLSW